MVDVLNNVSWPPSVWREPRTELRQPLYLKNLTNDRGINSNGKLECNSNP